MKETGASGQNKEVSPQISIDGDEGDAVKPSGQFMFRDNLLNLTHKFLGQVNVALQQVQIQGWFYFLDCDEAGLFH